MPRTKITVTSPLLPDLQDFNAMLRNSKDMPKFQTITDPASIARYGGDTSALVTPAVQRHLRAAAQ